MEECPCNGCETRHSHCHGNCKSYNNWVTLKDIRNEAIRRKKLLDSLMTLPEARVRKRNR